MITPIDLSNIRIITVSGRIASGSTTLAKGLARKLGWRHLEGGEIFWESVREKLGLEPSETHKRPDEEDENFDSYLKKLLKTGKHLVIETKLAGFNAQNIKGVYKMLVVCEDSKGYDQLQIRIDRLINRERLSREEAKKEAVEREKNDIEKWRRIYAKEDQRWVYWDKKYYDLTVNTYSFNQEESLKIALAAIWHKEH